MKYKNPIISGFNPDPSICKVGEDYYLATSTFEYFPGIPIYHSRDLVNWEHITNAVTRRLQLPLETVKASAGIWAPTLRYNNGYFYITATFSEGRNFIIYTDNPYGEWSDPVWTDMDGIDPSMLFDGDDMYYCANDCGNRGDLYKREGISVAQMNSKTGKVIGKIKRVWEGTGGGWIEAPHIYRIGDWYYILAAEGGTSSGHTEVCARSKSIWGPYENCPYNPILTNRNDTTKQASCSGHADLIEGNNGRWWLLHLATRPYIGGKTMLGRETFLTPVTWHNGWPVAEDKKAFIEGDIDAKKEIVTEKSFDFKSEKWENEWLSVRGRTNIGRYDGRLILKPSKEKLTDVLGVPTFVAIRQPDFECINEAELDFIPQNDGDEAGLVVYLTPLNNYRISKRRENGKNYIIVKRYADDFIQEDYRAEAEDGRIKFRVVSGNGKYEFFYSINGGTHISTAKVSAKFLTTDVADRCFTGTVIGVFAQADTDTNSKAYVYNYKCV